MKKRLLLAFGLLSLPAWADAPFRQFFDPSLNPEINEPAVPADKDAVVRRKNRRLRWEEQSRWQDLEQQAKDLHSQILTSEDCSAVRGSLGIISQTIGYERESYATNCLRNSMQLRGCLASQLRCDAMSDAMERLKQDASACLDVHAKVPAQNRVAGEIGTSLYYRKYRLFERNASDSDFFGGIEGQVSSSKNLSPDFSFDTDLNTVSQMSRSHFVGRQQGGVSGKYSTLGSSYNLGFRFSDDRGYFDLNQDKVNREDDFGFTANANFDINDRQLSLDYKPDSIHSSNSTYKGLRHQAALALSPQNQSRSLGYRFEWTHFSASAVSVYPTWNSLRILADASKLFGGHAQSKRTILVGLEERRDGSRVVRLLPYIDFKENFGPYDGSAWLADPTSFAKSFESSFHFQFRGQESRLTPTTQVISSEGELKMNAKKMTLPLRLGLDWSRNYFSTSTLTGQSSVFRVGLYPQYHVSAKFSFEFQVEYQRALFFDKITPDPKLWIYPYENFDKFFLGLKTLYEF